MTASQLTRNYPGSLGGLTPQGLGNGEGEPFGASTCNFPGRGLVIFAAGSAQAGGRKAPRKSPGQARAGAARQRAALRAHAERKRKKG